MAVFILPGPDTANMPVTVERRHWVSAIVGILDTAFSLSDIEQTDVYYIVDHLLTNIRVPERGQPSSIPTEVANEAATSFYSDSLYAASMGDRPTRTVTRPAEGDVVAPLDAWRTALEHMVTDAYRLEPKETIYLAAALDNLLAALNVENRAHILLPESVLNIEVGS